MPHPPAACIYFLQIEVQITCFANSCSLIPDRSALWSPRAHRAHRPHRPHRPPRPRAPRAHRAHRALGPCTLNRLCTRDRAPRTCATASTTANHRGVRRLVSLAWPRFVGVWGAWAHRGLTKWRLRPAWFAPYLRSLFALPVYAPCLRSHLRSLFALPICAPVRMLVLFTPALRLYPKVECIRGLFILFISGRVGERYDT